MRARQGAAQKVEGFYDACRIRFAVHAVATVDEGLALLSGREVGVRGIDGRFPPGTLNAEVDEALARHVERWRHLRISAPSAIGGQDGNDHEHDR